MAHPVENLMETTMGKVREMMDANTVVGKPIEVGNITVIPVSRISIGYGSGGSDFSQKSQKEGQPNAFGGGAGMGVNITPISFLIIRGDSVRVLAVEQGAATTLDKVISMVPDVVDTVTGFVEKKKDEKAGGAAEAAQTPEA